MSIWLGIICKSVILTPVMVLFLALGRRIRNRIKPGLRCVLWMVLLLILVLPPGIFKIKTPVGMRQTLPAEYFAGTQYANTVIDAEQNAVEEQSNVRFEEYRDDVNVTARLTDIAFTIWLAGCVCFFAIHIISGLIFRKRLGKLHKKIINDTVCYVSDKITSPAVMGVLCPKILVPEHSIYGQEICFILEHEKSHIQHADIYKKIFALAVNMLFWYHPCVWLIRKKMSADIEFACDERVMKHCSMNERIRYGETLLEGARQNSNRGSAVSILFSQKSNLKDRIYAIVRRPKLGRGIPYFILALSVMICSIITLVPSYASDKTNEYNERVENTPEIIPLTSEEKPKWPLDEKYHDISSSFGMRLGVDSDSGELTENDHQGIDITYFEDVGQLIGKNIYAVFSGTVIQADYYDEGSMGVILRGNNGYIIIYNNCNTVNVNPGEKVKQGDIIGTLGMSEMSTGVYLHFGIMKDNQYIDPLSLYE